MDFRRTDSLATNASLLERLKDLEDQASWQEFCATYRNLIFSFALRHGLSPTESEEVVQETFITVARNLPQFRYDPKRCSFKTWLFNLTLWRIRDQLRRRRPQAASMQHKPAKPTELAPSNGSRDPRERDRLSCGRKSGGRTFSNGRWTR